MERSEEVEEQQDDVAPIDLYEIQTKAGDMDTKELENN